MGRNSETVRDYFTKKMFCGFLISSVFSAIGLAFANIADSLVVGMRIGEAGLAAIAITSPIYMLFAFFYVAIGTGGAVAFSKLAAEDRKLPSDLFSMMMEASLLVSLIFVLTGIFFTRELLFLLGVTPADGQVYQLSYSYAHILLCSAPVFFLNTPLYLFIRCDDAQKHSSFGFVAGNCVDVALNFLFVLVLDMGVVGTVWSTVIGQMVSVIIYVPHFFKRNSLLKARFVKLKFNIMYQTFITGFSVSIQYVFQFLFIITANYVLLKTEGSYAVAIFDVVLNVSYIGLCIHNASNEAMQPLTGMFFGEKNPVQQKKVYHLAQKFGSIVGSILLLAIAIFAKEICSLYNCQIGLGSYAVRAYCVGAVFAGINIIACGYYQSVAREKLAFFITLLRNFIFLVPITVIFGAIGIHAFWWIFLAAEVLTLIASFFAGQMQKFKCTSPEIAEERIITFLLAGNKKVRMIPNENIKAFCEKWGADFKQIYYVTMTIEEICGAIMENAFEQEGKSVHIQTTLIAYETGEFELHIRDNASSFNPFDLKTKKVSIDDTENELKALGILMVKKKAKRFFYRRYQGLNTLIVNI